jgi:hypothetical protein
MAAVSSDGALLKAQKAALERVGSIEEENRNEISIEERNARS